MTAPVLTVSKNSGDPATGAITCTWEDTIRLRLQSTAGVRSARFEIYGYPPGWSAPSGWTEDVANRVIYATGVTPDDFTLPTAASNDWGKWLLRAIVDGETDDGATALEILSPGGLHATPAGEGAQFGGAAEQWAKDLEENWRLVDDALGGGNSVVYKPGGVASGNVYTTWATAVAAAQEVAGIVTINVDASLGTPTFSGTVNLQRRIRVVAFGPSLPVSATLASGAVLQNATYFEGITFAGNLSASVFTTTDGSPHDLTFVGCARAETADAADLIELATGANKISFLGAAAFTSASRAAVTLVSGKNVTLQVSNLASLGSGVVAGSAGTLTASVAAAASLSTSGFSGTLSRTNADTESARTTAVDAAAGWDGPEQGFGTDGAVSYSAGGAASALTAPMYATNLTISPNVGTPTTLSMAAYPVMGTGTLTLGTNCVLHHNGTSVAANTQAGGTAAATGHLGNTQQAGANGGAINSSGGNATTQSNALGAAGGSGGKGSQPGGTSPAATFPVPASVGRWISSMFLFCLSGSFTKPAGGGGGSSGGGDVDSTGSGGGSGGGVAKVCFKSIVMGSGAKISCDGGAGGSNSNGAGGGGGGGGGYLEVHCDELTLAVADDYASHFTCAGGAGGTATGGGVSGSAGSAGRVRVFLRGKLVYST